MFKSKELTQPPLTFNGLLDAFLDCKDPYYPEWDIDSSLRYCLHTQFTEEKLQEMMGKFADETASIHEMLNHLRSYLFSGETYIENFLMCVEEIKKFNPTDQEKNIIDKIRKLHKHIKEQHETTVNLCKNRCNYMNLTTGYLTSSRQTHWKNIFEQIFTQCDMIAKLIASYNQEK